MSGGRRTMELGDVRRHHLSLVVETLLADGARTRAQLAQDIGLTKATVSSLVTDLLDHGVVVEREARRDGRMGRPGVGIELQAEHIGALGLEICIDDVAACIVDLTGAVRTVHRVESDNRDGDPEPVVRRLHRMATAALDEAAAHDIRCVGGALAVPGLVDPATRALVVAPNLHWHDVVLTPVADDLGLDLLVENEANLAALAELRHGVAQDLSSFVYVSGGVGIGGGLVLDGRVLTGSSGFAGEIGHVVVDADGPACACGANGCLEAVIGADASAPSDRVADALSRALRSTVHLVDPQGVVLGGTLAGLDDQVVAGIADRLAEDTLGGRWHACEVRRSTHGADAALIGAATTALDAFIADPTISTIDPESSARTA